MAATFSATWESSQVSTPMPGPTSMTPAHSWAPHSAAIRGHTPGLIRKFCPSALEKWNPWRDKISLIRPGSDRPLWRDVSLGWLFIGILLCGALSWDGHLVDHPAPVVVHAGIQAV